MRMRWVGSWRLLLWALALGCGGGSPAGDRGPPIATAVAAGSYHTCAVVNGGVQCWGSNFAGALGINSTADSLVPVRVQGIASGATAVSAGQHVSCAVVDGGLKCWGYNKVGTVGDGSTAEMQLPWGTCMLKTRRMLWAFAQATFWSIHAQPASVSKVR